ncbi:hypothetical protein Lepto7375DRAFT_3869 [Leptolyngbya sp. PCC 7375]|nr:hypothetical protein Lepto7375DRAFT_3869 [Leptolyngbya sp. PCC 7375]
MKLTKTCYKWFSATVLTVTLATSTSSPSWASSVDFARLQTRTAGTVSEIALSQCVNKAVTALRDSDGNLRMRHWSVTEENLLPLAETGNAYLAGPARDIAITRLNGCNFNVTALRTVDSKLKLIAWISGNNGMVRGGDAEAGDVSEVAIARVKHPSSSTPAAGRVVTAIKNSRGNLQLIVWDVFTNGTIHRRGDIEAGEASEINIIGLPATTSGGSDSRVLTAIRTEDGRLKLITWGIQSNGSISRLAEATAGDISKVDLTEIPGQRVVTAVRTGEGTLKLIAWDVSHPEFIHRQGDDDEPLNQNTAGPIREVSITAWEPDAFTPGDDVAVAVRTNAGDLKIISWSVLPSGDFTRSGDSGDLAGAANLVNISWSRISKRLLTAIRDEDNNLRLITWRGY